MAHRKSPSLHIRFEGFKLIDTLEVWAHKRGEKIVPWARRALLKQARFESAEEIILNAVHNSSLEAVLLLREIAGKEASERAKSQIHKFKDQVRSDVAKQFDNV